MYIYARILIRKPYLRGSKIEGVELSSVFNSGRASADELEARNERKRSKGGVDMMELLL